MNEKISIIIPCYNTERFLPKCLDSVVNQTYRNLEIICIIDGSPDSSLTICNQYAEKDKRIVVINQDNQGLSGARNTGLSVSKGDYIMFLDSDDWIETTTCEKAVARIENNDCDLVIWSYVREFKDSQKEKMILGNEDIVFDSYGCKKLHRRIFGLYEEELSNPEDADSLVTACGKLYRASLIKNIDFVDTKIIGTEDALFNCYALKNVETAYYIAECLYHYRKDNDNSLTSNYKENLFTQWNCLFDLMQQCIDDNNHEKDFNQALNNRIALSVIGLGLNELDNPNGKIPTIIRRIKGIISSKRYREAYKALILKYFPIHWKVFFLFAKMNFATGLYVLLVIIKKMIGK